jgi:hypothetical protein
LAAGGCGHFIQKAKLAEKGSARRLYFITVPRRI